MIIKIKSKIIPYGRKIQGLCKKPYYNHSKGCPNYRKKIGCPPNQPLINNILDFNKDIYLIYTIFNVGEFAEKMRKNHPEWKKYPRQWYNPRRWQPRARKFQRAEENKALEKYKIEKIVQSPEAYGVNLTGLMKNVGISLNWDWPPKHSKKNIVYLISLGGIS